MFHTVCTLYNAITISQRAPSCTSARHVAAPCNASSLGFEVARVSRACVGSTSVQVLSDGPRGNQRVKSQVTWVAINLQKLSQVTWAATTLYKLDNCQNTFSRNASLREKYGASRHLAEANNGVHALPTWDELGYDVLVHLRINCGFEEDGSNYASARQRTFFA